jgi:hypothetical protein
MLDAQRDLLAAKERTDQLDRSDEWLLAASAAPRITLIKLGQSTCIARFNCRGRARLRRG